MSDVKDQQQSAQFATENSLIIVKFCFDKFIFKASEVRDHFQTDEDVDSGRSALSFVVLVALKTKPLPLVRLQLLPGGK